MLKREGVFKVGQSDDQEDNLEKELRNGKCVISQFNLLSTKNDMQIAMEI